MFRRRSTLARSRRQKANTVKISVYVADATSGVPVGDLPARLGQWGPQGWRRLWVGQTSLDGRVSDLSVPGPEAALFEFVLDTERYYTTLGLVPFFSKVRIVFNGGDGERYLPIVLAPHSYAVCAIVARADAARGVSRPADRSAPAAYQGAITRARPGVCPR